MCRFYFIQTPLDICMKENINLKGVCDKTHISYRGLWGFNTFDIMRRTQHLLFSKASPAEKWSTSYPYDWIMSLCWTWSLFAAGIRGLGTGWWKVTCGFGLLAGLEDGTSRENNKAFISGGCQGGSSCWEQQFGALWSWASIASTTTASASPEPAVEALVMKEGGKLSALVL